MSINGSTKEFIFSLILKSNTELISDLINGEYQHIALEKNYQGMYIDMYGLEIQNSIPIYIENQLTVSDPTHYKQVLDTIDAVDNGIVIWIAERFVDKYVDNLYNYLNFSIAKPLNFYAVTFNSEYLEQINELNKMTQFEAWNLIDSGLIEKPLLTVLDSIEIIPDGYKGKEIIQNSKDNLVTVKGRNKYLLQKLRERVPYLFNLHRAKKLENKTIVIGAGQSDIDFSISLGDENKRAYIKLRIVGSHRKPLLNEVEREMKSSSFLSNMDFLYKNNSVSYMVNANLGFEEKVEAMAEAFEKMVQVITPITYSKGA